MNYCSEKAATIDHHILHSIDCNFRRIRWGDVDLRRELYACSSTQTRARVVYSAEVDGRKFTLAIYHGGEAEKQWKQDVEQDMDIRHENILQLYGIVQHRNIYAMLFHGDFIPFENFLETYEHCPITICYIYAYANLDFQSALNYLYTNFRYQGILQYRMLIRCSTGQFCLDLGDA
ncbi:hypothetical protein R3P38DRAFT_3123541 [Favolaschia claudopus]|uniref:Protein kinase domain-containing protein n=1 Tax=Favolaschia claudopus TaxID=2862362 RepID=A0AAV9ZCY8_9AGAR